MLIEDINNEKDILMFVGSRYKQAEVMLNKLFDEKDIEFISTEYSIPKYEGRRKVYGGGRADIMYAGKNIAIPIELKYKANDDSVKQLNKYINGLKELTTQKVKGLIMCKYMTHSLKYSNIGDDIYILELTTGKLY